MPVDALVFANGSPADPPENVCSLGLALFEAAITAVVLIALPSIRSLYMKSLKIASKGQPRALLKRCQPSRTEGRLHGFEPVSLGLVDQPSSGSSLWAPPQ